MTIFIAMQKKPGEVFYNQKRRHSYLNYKAPLEHKAMMDMESARPKYRGKIRSIIS